MHHDGAFCRPRHLKVLLLMRESQDTFTMTDRFNSEPVEHIDHVDALLPGTQLAEFEIQALLGVGGFGMVYKAFDHSLRRAVAIKEYMPSALAGRAQGQALWVRSSADQDAFQAGLNSFVTEARLLAQFDHPSLVKVFRFWEANNTAYMVMPLYSGMTLKQARALMSTPPSEMWLRKVLWSVLDALRVLHDSSTLHRDISPDNIFLQDCGPPVLLDLGAARHAINDHGHRHTAVLKVNYAPIEQYAEGDAQLRQGPWSDLYSLAAVVHGCLCNDVPLPATLRSIRDRMVSFSRVAKTVRRQFGVSYSAPFVTAITQALSVRPADRPQSIDAFLLTMQMTAPLADMRQFDFRSELGAVWSDPAHSSAATSWLLAPSAAHHAGGTVEGVASDDPLVCAAGSDVSSDEGADTVFLEMPGSDRGTEGADTVVMEYHAEEPDIAVSSVHGGKAAGVAVSEGAAPVKKTLLISQKSRHAVSGKNGKKRAQNLFWMVVVLVCVLAVTAGIRWSQKEDVSQDIITEWSTTPSTPASEAVPLVNVARADADAVVPSSESSGVPQVPLAVTASAALLPQRAASVSRSPVKVVKRVAPVSPPAPSGESDVAVSETMAPVAPASVSKARVPQRPVHAPTPQEACASSNFFSRPVCIHQECQKPAQHGQPICVENRRKYEAEEQRRLHTPN